jgi:hypothetical protein
MALFGKRKQRELLELERLRLARRMANEDVTVLGEELIELHYETLTVDLQGEIGDDYQQALDAYERAKQQLRLSEGPELVRELQPVLDEGRYRLACVLSRSEGRPLPERLPPCFFNPQHGPSYTEVDWQPPGGVERRVPVCLSDGNRLEQQRMPAIRMVQIGNQLVPWYDADEAFGLFGGEVDYRRVRELRRTHLAQGMQYSNPANLGRDLRGGGL